MQGHQLKAYCILLSTQCTFLDSTISFKHFSSSYMLPCYRFMIHSALLTCHPVIRQMCRRTGRYQDRNALYQTYSTKQIFTLFVWLNIVMYCQFVIEGEKQYWIYKHHLYTLQQQSSYLTNSFKYIIRHSPLMFCFHIV